MDNLKREIPQPEAVRLDDLQGQAPEVNWLWRGYLARGSVTLLTSLWKAGKTTLLAALLSRLREGGSFAGQPLSAGRAAVVSEEPLDMWQRRSERLHLGGHVFFFCRPFSEAPTSEHWQRLVAALEQLHEQQRLDLIAIDPLAAFLPAATESNSGVMMQVLLPLHRLAKAGVAILLLHHPRKGDPPLGQAARGTGALGGFADVVLEMKSRQHMAQGERRRRLLGFSRFDETPPDVILELNEAGSDYLAHGEPDDDEFQSIWPILQQLLEHAEQKLTRRELLERWPRPENKPADVTLWRWLERGVEQKLILKDTDVAKNRPFRYWLTGRTVERAVLFDLPPLLPLEEERLR
ncbi:MAG TPA: AAA family ATPase [Gemmataceae bacterium]|nr:AAA family ATPase [Gemmataceae bacterium]